MHLPASFPPERKGYLVRGRESTPSIAFEDHLRTVRLPCMGERERADGSWRFVAFIILPPRYELFTGESAFSRR